MAVVCFSPHVNNGSFVVFFTIVKELTANISGTGNLFLCVFQCRDIAQSQLPDVGLPLFEPQEALILEAGGGLCNNYSDPGILLADGGKQPLNDAHLPSDWLACARFLTSPTSANVPLHTGYSKTEKKEKRFKGTAARSCCAESGIADQ